MSHIYTGAEQIHMETEQESWKFLGEVWRTGQKQMQDIKSNDKVRRSGNHSFLLISEDRKKNLPTIFTKQSIDIDEKRSIKLLTM